MKAPKTFSNRPEPETKSAGVYLDMGPMPTAVAERVKVLRQGDTIHSWRRVAEVICEEFPDQPVRDGWGKSENAHGNQLYGIDLCRVAAATLGEDIEVWEQNIEEWLA